MILLGVAGSGRRTLCRLATFMSSMQVWGGGRGGGGTSSGMASYHLPIPPPVPPSPLLPVVIQLFEANLTEGSLSLPPLSARLLTLPLLPSGSSLPPLLLSAFRGQPEG